MTLSTTSVSYSKRVTCSTRSFTAAAPPSASPRARPPPGDSAIGRLLFRARREQVGLTTEKTHHAVGALEVRAEGEEIPRLVVSEGGPRESLEMLKAFANETLERQAVALRAPLRAGKRKRLVEG